MGHRIFGAILGAFWFSVALAEPVAVHFDQIPIKDFAKVVYGDIVKTGYVVHESAEDSKISVYFPRSEPKQIERLAVDALKAAGLSVERAGGVVVINKPKPVDHELITYRPKYRAVSYLGDLIQAGVPGVVLGARRAVPNIPQAAAGQAGGKGVAPITGDVGSAAMFDKPGSSDVLVALVAPERAAVVRKLLEQLDVETPEIVVRAVAYEVQKNDRQGSAIDLVLSLLKGKLSIDVKGSVAGADASISIKTGDFSAVISALDSDTRFRSLARPSVRVKSGSLARFAVGSDVPVLGAVVTQQVGQSVQSVEYRSSGVLLDVTPQVRDERIELRLKQEFSTFVQTTTGVSNSPTLNKRSAETELSIQPGEVVFIGGLELDESTNSQQALPFGIPFGRSDERRRNELVLMIQADRI